MIIAHGLNPQRRAAIKMFKTLPKRGICAEVGVYRGDFSTFILKYLNPKSLHLIDPWQWRDQWHVQHSEQELQIIESGAATSEGEEIYLSVVDRFKHDKRVHITRNTSHVAASLFPDEHFDFVFIDADHRYQPALADMQEWWPKLKPGGWLCGDDYDTAVLDGDKLSMPNGVCFAVREFNEENNVKATLIPWGDGDPRAHFMIQKPGPARAISGLLAKLGRRVHMQSGAGN